MFTIFTQLADWVTYQLLSIDSDTHLAEAVHFFIEDTTKIFALLAVMIYFIALLRASLNVERVRDYLEGKNKWFSYFLASIFGAITPFCSCSSIPVFLGFSLAGIPVGTTMAFLLTSPLINEVAVLLLFGLLGWKFTIIYIVLGMLVGIFGGWFLDKIHAERWLESFAADALKEAQDSKNKTGGDVQAVTTDTKMPFEERHEFAKAEMKDIVGRVWKWVFIGVGLGAALHGFVPDGWITAHLGEKQWWSVPVSVVLGIPLYSNATGIIPVMESLLINGLPIGTTLAFCMSTVAASFPEAILLKQVMQWKLLAILFSMLLTAFTLIGWIFNILM